MNIEKQFQKRAAQIILDYFDKMMAQEAGTILGEDIEYLHRMRVSSRRLRARLEDFAPLFGDKQYRNVQKRIRRMTSRLGRVRDLDVLHHFLSQALPVEARRAGGATARSPQVPEALLAALEDLRSRGRARLQKYFRKLHKRGHIRDIRRYFKTRARGRLAKGALRRHMVGFARQVVEPRLDAVLSFEQEDLKGPEKLPRIHALRIKAKQLRYSMEIFEIYYGREFSRLVKEVRRLQDAAGKVHDYEVYGDRVGELAETRHVPAAECGDLLGYCERRRRLAVAAFHREWRRFVQKDLAGRLAPYWSAPPDPFRDSDPTT